MKRIEFIDDINDSENIDEEEMKAKGKRVIYVIAQCIPIPILEKATVSESLIIPLPMSGDLQVKCVFKAMNSYFQENLDS